MKLTRFAHFTDRTLGLLHYGTDSWWTIERPWKNNRREVSCIPEGHYEMVRVDSPRFGPNMWEIASVPDRSHILLHIANTASDILGCVGLGTGLYGDLAGVSNSRKAITAFYNLTQADVFHTIDISSGVIRGK